ncbi:hypothetical protein PHMEG_00029450 [Phytophthora megakarya]|uniref:Uncharacterized protein n=1 Tax=Phytophthora megakarya TaxID=4795 RepID=A0A225V149_9STRA|nr:hypothetical protein PHMEG_00029450 [Phytophthora megakarya]
MVQRKNVFVWIDRYLVAIQALENRLQTLGALRYYHGLRPTLLLKNLQADERRITYGNSTINEYSFAAQHMQARYHLLCRQILHRLRSHHKMNKTSSHQLLR